jgi:4'-phosphopantetheinyl transferase
MPQGRRRRRWVASRWALREVLSRYLDESPAAIELALDGNGKPALAGPAPSLHFNLSHSGGLALVAVAGERQVGVDIERIDPRRDPLRLAKRALDPAAAAAVQAAPPGDRLTVFHQAWARHEALVKCHGTGLRGPRPATPVVVMPLDLGPRFAAAAAIATEAMPRLRLFELAESRRSSSRRLASRTRASRWLIPSVGAGI